MELAPFCLDSLHFIFAFFNYISTHLALLPKTEVLCFQFFFYLILLGYVILFKDDLHVGRVFYFNFLNRYVLLFYGIILNNTNVTNTLYRFEKRDIDISDFH